MLDPHQNPIIEVPERTERTKQRTEGSTEMDAMGGEGGAVET